MANIWTWFVSNLEDVKRWYKEMLMIIARNNRAPNLVSTTRYQNNATFKEIGLLKTWSIHHHEKNQCHGLSSKFQIPWKSIMCFIFHYWSLTMHPPFQEKFPSHFHQLKSMVNKNTKWKKNYWLKNTKWLVAILHSVARLWCERTHMGAS